MNSLIKHSIFWAVLLSAFSLTAQENGKIYGTITSSDGELLVGAYVLIEGSTKAETSDSTGRYELKIPANKPVIIVVSFVGHNDYKQTVQVTPGERKKINFKLAFRTEQIGTFTIEGRKDEEVGVTTIKPKIATTVSSPSSSIEKTLVFQGMGVTTRNEMSSQYNVRGGNFDENLIYVNGIEIHRSFLVRSGRQEGLSFVNPELVETVSFSSGGFESKYGDKMSSVLDITYKEPTRRFGGFAEVSLLGGQLAIESSSKDHRFTQIHGFRYRTNQYLLNSLDTKGDYSPSFLDYQGNFTYDISDNVEIGFLASVASNKYNFIPQTRQTEFGTFNEALRLTVFYEGQEIDQYQTMLGALSLTAIPNKKTLIRFIASAYRTSEDETFDISGAYRLDELDRDPGSANFGEVAFNRGVGGFIEHARNYYDGLVTSFVHDGSYYFPKSTLSWGVQGNLEWIDDIYREWDLIDSSGYSIPQKPSDEIVLAQSYRSENHLNWFRGTAFGQWERTFDLDSNKLTLNIGARLNYWNFNNQVVGGPRVLLYFTPSWKTDISFKLAWGIYNQAPSYREMRNIQGFINPEIKAQQAIHYVLGMDYRFRLWKRNFKFSTEAYYKQLNHLIPYELDNVRIRYYATNNSKGYATGIDLKLNGEFVKGVESWMSLSFMKTAEDLSDDFYYEYFNAEGDQVRPGDPFDPAVDSTRIEPGYIPRPTDQRINFAIFFQDYIPGNKTYKMNITVYLATGLPFGPPTFEKYNDVLRMPPYRRVDIGFSKELLINKHGKRNKIGQAKGFRNMDSFFIAVEFFNLLNIQNTISYSWVRDIQNRYYAVPNHLTNRQVNVKLQMRF